MPAVDEHDNALTWREDTDPSCDPKDTCSKKCRRVPNNKNEVQPSMDQISLFHYVTKSREDFQAKLERWEGKNWSRDWDYFEAVNRHDPFICAKILMFAQKYQI